jgi:hypothetical protein
MQGMKVQSQKHPLSDFQTSSQAFLASSPDLFTATTIQYNQTCFVFFVSSYEEAEVVRLVIRQYFKLLTSRHDRIKSQFHPAFGRWRSETENGLAESHIDICKVSHLLVMGSLSCENTCFYSRSTL